MSRQRQLLTVRVAYLGSPGTFSEDALRGGNRGRGGGGHPVRLRLRRDRRRPRGGRPSGRSSPSRTPSRARSRHPRHARLRRRRPRSGRRVRPPHSPLPDRQDGSCRWSGSRSCSPTRRRALSAPASFGRTCRRLRFAPPPAPPRRSGRSPSPTRPWAALGAESAAGLYGAAVLRHGVEDEADNITRFVWVARRGRARPGPGRGGPRSSSRSWARTTGALVDALQVFAGRGVNLTRIESRPLRRGLGRYQFFLDIEGAAGDEPLADRNRRACAQGRDRSRARQLADRRASRSACEPARCSSTIAREMGNGATAEHSAVNGHVAARQNGHDPAHLNGNGSARTGRPTAR